MFCFFCGKENNDNQKYCKYCGKSLYPGVSVQNVEIETGTDPTTASEYPEKKREHNGLLITIAILLLLILIVLGTILFTYLRSDAVNPIDMIKGVGNKPEAEASVDETEVKSDKYEERNDSESYDNKDDKTPTDDAPIEDSKAEVRTGTVETGDTDQDDKEAGNFKEDNKDIETVTDPDTEDESINEEDNNVKDESEEKTEEEKVKLNISYVEASSVLKAASKDHVTYDAHNVMDGDYKTAWVEGVDGNGEGQILILHLDGAHKISKLKIFDGFLKTKRRYSINGRVTRALIDYGNGYQQVVDFNVIYPPEVEAEFTMDEMGETEIIPETECITDTVTVTIMNAVAGSKYEDTAVSEIEIYGE